MNDYLKKLLASLFPAVDDDDLPELPDDAPDDEPVDEPDDDQVDDIVDDEPEERPRRAASRDTSGTREMQAALERARRLEEDVENLKRSSGAPSEDQRTRQEEDRQLADPNVNELTKWQINANRTLRETQGAAKQALMQAQDMQDRAAFMSKATSDPRRAKYQDRVEKELTTLRSKGQNVDRETLYFYQLGKDIAEGKLKAAPKKASAAANVPRGKTPAARSDVRSKGNNRSASGARERLMDKPI